MSKNRNGVYSFTLTILIPLLSGSCVTLAEIDINVMDPAEVSLPGTVHEIAFVNRAPFPQLDAGMVSSDYWTDSALYLYDSLMSQGILNGVTRPMMQSPLYDFKELTAYSLLRGDTSDRSEPIQEIILRRLARVQPADVLLSLEDFRTSENRYVMRKYIMLERVFEAYKGVYTTSSWRIYDLNMYSLIDEYVMKDTTEWYHYEYSRASAEKHKEIGWREYAIAARNTGQRYGKRISPKWEEVPRYYHYLGGIKMSKAGRLAGAEQWKEAAVIWRDLAYKNKKGRAARASYNMALVCEMEDLLEPALDWANRSKSIREKDLTDEYVMILEKRIQERKKLKSQLPETF